MKLFPRFCFLALLASLSLSIAHAQATKKAEVPADVAAIVDGVAIKKSVLDRFLASLGANVKVTPEVRMEVLNLLVQREVLAAESVRRGTDKKPDFQQRMNDEKHRLLSEALLTEFSTQNPVTEKDIQAEYERQKQALGGDNAPQFLLSQIVLATDQEARDVITRIKKGEAFDKLATALSTDTATKAKGGQIGWVLPLELSPLFGNVIVNLAKGAHTAAPIQFNNAWHILRVDDTRPYKLPTMEESRAQLTAALQAQKRQKVVADLMKKATVQMGNL